MILPPESQGVAGPRFRANGKRLILISLVLCVASGCGGGGSSQAPPPPPAPNPVPTLSGVTPNSAVAGSSALTITASGSGFVSGATIEWNGAALATTYISSSSLTAQVAVFDLAVAGTAAIAVRNPAPGGGTSATVSFTLSWPTAGLTIVNVEGSDLAWDSSQKKLYVAVPGNGSVNPGTITVVDPIAGAIVGAQTLSSAASGLAISDDDHYLYAAINGAATIQRFLLPAFTPDIQWSLGTDAGSGSANLAGDMEVQPGAAHTVAVSLGAFRSGTVAIFSMMESSGREWRAGQETRCSGSGTGPGCMPRLRSPTTAAPRPSPAMMPSIPCR